MWRTSHLLASPRTPTVSIRPGRGRGRGATHAQSTRKHRGWGCSHRPNGAHNKKELVHGQGAPERCCTHLACAYGLSTPWNCAHARRGACGHGAWARGELAPGHFTPGAILCARGALQARPNSLLLSPVHVPQVRAMNEHSVSCLRTQLGAVRARTREAQAACTSCI